MRVEIETPDDFAGALLGDLNARRGRVQGMESGGAGTMVRAEVPHGRDVELWDDADFDYARGEVVFRMEMDHYGRGAFRCWQTRSWQMRSSRAMRSLMNNLWPARLRWKASSGRLSASNLSGETPNATPLLVRSKFKSLSFHLASSSFPLSRRRARSTSIS